MLDEIYAYKVDQIDIILPDETSLYLQTEADKDWITLMTYTPYGVPIVYW